MQEEGEEVHCNLGKTWRDLFKKQLKDRKGVCRKKRKREEELEEVKNYVWLRMERGFLDWVGVFGTTLQ